MLCLLRLLRFGLIFSCCTIFYVICTRKQHTRVSVPPLACPSQLTKSISYAKNLPFLAPPLPLMGRFYFKLASNSYHFVALCHLHALIRIMAEKVDNSIKNWVMMIHHMTLFDNNYLSSNLKHAWLPSHPFSSTILSPLK